MFSATTNEVKKTISRFDKGAYGGCFRGDGRLLAAGTDDGSVKVCKKKRVHELSMLRTYFPC